MKSKDKDLQNLSLMVKVVLGISFSVSLLVTIFTILIFFLGTKV